MVGIVEYVAGQKPPGLAEDGSFETATGRVKSVVDKDGYILVVDVTTGLLIYDPSDDE